MTGVMWAVTDSWTMTRRGLAHWARRPGQVVVGLVFPVMMLVMFAYFLGGGMAVPGGGDYKEYLLPGMFALTMAFGLESTMVAVTQDLGKGVIDRFRSMPMASSAVLVGRSVLDMLQSALSLLVMIGAGLAMGWRWHGGTGQALGAVGLLLLLRFAMLWIGIYLGLVAGRPEMVQAAQILVWPVGFLSNAFVWAGSMPGWLGAVAEWNPLSATAGAVRELFGNPPVTGGSWASGHAGMLAVVWPVLLLAVFFPLAVRRYGRMGR
ncbi:ABC transporter permease [Streptomyces chattanoogensis]|uniref:Transport permease protein n=1 Tax=Streptomyces chattanoogensis TaxID=66876 RepID=A0A0N0H3J1_9ACTN|nr:ABC transporter permease [Streptomyces chattanoogensis]KPC66020.1 multidrug ABC transporter permease [Streptomyces chattanoogensis]